MEQKNAVKKLKIHIYGAKRALDRPWQGSPWGTPQAGTAGPSSSKPSNAHHMSRGQRWSLQTAKQLLLMNVLSRFRRILGSIWGPSRYETTKWGARLGTVRRHFVGLERSLAFQTRAVASCSISAVKRFIRCRCSDLP